MLPLRFYLLTLRRSIRVWQRHVTVYKKLYRSSLALNFVEPLLYLTAMGLGMGAYIDRIDGTPYINYLAPGVVAYSSVFAAAFECTYGTYVRMTYQHTFDAILATPVSLDELVLGEMLWGATKSLVYGVIIMLVVVALGLQGSYMLVLALPFVFLGGLVFAEISVSFAALAPAIDYFNYFFTLFVTPMFLFSGVFFPLEGLHPLAERVAFFTPLYHMVKITRGLSQGVMPWGHMAWIAVAAVVLMPLPFMLMRRRLAKKNYF